MAIVWNCAAGYLKFKQFQDIGGGVFDLHFDITPGKVP